MICLTLFFTRGVSLKTWEQIGSLEREIAPYVRLSQKKGIQVSFVTYGDTTDLKFRDQLSGIEILCNRWRLPSRIYEKLIPFLHAHAFTRTDLIKTNQTNGADTALRTARLWQKMLLVRCGYMWSDFAMRGGRVQEGMMARRIERSVFTAAQHVIVTTASMKDYIIENYYVPSKRIHIIPNFVLTDIFNPDNIQKVSKRICFIGRLSEQKNLFSLVQACTGLDVELVFIGEGQLRTALQEKAMEINVPLSLAGNLPHHQLPEEIRQSALFALVSYFEGHPKALLEAMSCGAAVLGADSPGIREQIIHGETGWLVGTDPDSIRSGIQHLLANPSLRQKMGANARRFAVENYSLEKIVEAEYMLIMEIMKNNEKNGRMP